MTNSGAVTSLPRDVFLHHVLGRLNEPGANKENTAAYTLVLGAGFSAPLIPTASGIVKQDVAWWKYCCKHPDVNFGDKPLDGEQREAVEKIAQEMWASLAQGSHGLPSDQKWKQDSETGLPETDPNNIAKAYQALMDGRLTGGLNTPDSQRNYFRAVCARVGKRMNLAHIYLGSILYAQSQTEWKESKRCFCRTIFTTNFDSLLQRSLQLHNQLYFMTDGPEASIDPPEDDVDQAIHLIYSHGSVHRRHLANSSGDIRKAQVHAPQLSQCLSRHGVIVIGYGGWDDAVFEAMKSCSQFDGKLYWCGRSQSADQLPKQVREFLTQDSNNRFYVSLGDGGADDLMRELHYQVTGNKSPFILGDPAQLIIEELNAIDWPDDDIQGGDWANMKPKALDGGHLHMLRFHKVVHL